MINVVMATIMAAAALKTAGKLRGVLSAEKAPPKDTVTVKCGRNYLLLS